MRRCANGYGNTPTDNIGVKCNILDWQLDWIGGRIAARALRRRSSNEKQVDREGKRSRKSRLSEHYRHDNGGNMNFTNARERDAGWLYLFMSGHNGNGTYTLKRDAL